MAQLGPTFSAGQKAHDPAVAAQRPMVAGGGGGGAAQAPRRADRTVATPQRGTRRPRRRARRNRGRRDHGRRHGSAGCRQRTPPPGRVLARRGSPLPQAPRRKAPHPPWLAAARRVRPRGPAGAGGSKPLRRAGAQRPLRPRRRPDGRPRPRGSVRSSPSWRAKGLAPCPRPACWGSRWERCVLRLAARTSSSIASPPSPPRGACVNSVPRRLPPTRRAQPARTRRDWPELT